MNSNKAPQQFQFSFLDDILLQKLKTQYNCEATNKNRNEKGFFIIEKNTFIDSFIFIRILPTLSHRQNRLHEVFT